MTEGVDFEKEGRLSLFLKMGEENKELRVVQLVGMTRKRSTVEERKVLDRLSSTREKTIELWSNVKHQVVEFSALPKYLRDNNYIIDHYFVNYPFKHALRFVFSIHNRLLMFGCTCAFLFSLQISIKFCIKLWRTFRVWICNFIFIFFLLNDCVYWQECGYLHVHLLHGFLLFEH